MLDRLAEPLIQTFGSLDAVPPGWRGVLESLSETLASAEDDRDRLARALERATAELQELVVEVGALRQARETAESTNLVRGEILALASQVMRTPTNVVLGLTGLLRLGSLLPTQRSYVEGIHGAAESLLRLLNDISDFSRLESGTLPLEPIPFDLKVMVEDAARMLTLQAEARGAMLRVAWRPDAPRRVVGDPGRIRQVLIALVEDALGRTERGEVVVEVARGEPHEGLPVVRLLVEDSGPPIPADLVPTLFEPFTRGDAYPVRGTGLALSIARQLARLMHGNLEVSEIPGAGTRFLVWMPLPLAEAPTAPVPPLPSAIPVTTRAALLLVTEADDGQRAEWCALAEEVGYDVVPLARREEVPEAFRRSAREGRPVAVCVFSDHDASGYEALGRTLLAEADPDRPALVMLPAVGLPGDVRRLREAGFVAYLVKPVDQVDLREALRALHGVPRAERHLVFITRYSLAEARGRAGGHEADVEETLARLVAPSLEPESRPSGVGETLVEAKEAGAGSARLVGRLAELFRAEVPARLAVLREKVAVGEGIAAAREARTLRGMCGLLGQGRIATLCGDLEKRAETGGLAGAEALLEEIAAECERALANLDPGV